MNIFTSFTDQDVVNANPTQVSVGIFSGDTGSLTSFYTSSTQTASLSAQYYWDIYNINPTSSQAEAQFSIAYGHLTNGGNPTLTQNQNSVLATETTYFQYRNILLDPNDPSFTFLGNYNSPHIFVINFYRNRLKQELDPGNWVLFLSGSSGSFSFIDDSGQTLGPQFGKSGQIFNVVSGSLTGVSGSTIAPNSASVASGGFGLFYPEVGLILLNPDALTNLGVWSVANAIQVGNVNPAVYNQAHLYNSMVRGGVLGGFQCRSAETISSTFYSVYIRAGQLCYSNNPTFFDSTSGKILNADFANNPVVYVTSVGLYDDNNELLAVAKLSKPVKHSFTDSTLISARIDW